METNDCKPVDRGASNAAPAQAGSLRDQEMKAPYPGVWQALGLLVVTVVLMFVVTGIVAGVCTAVGLSPMDHPAVLLLGNVLSIGAMLVVGLRRTGAPFAEVFPLRAVAGSVFVPLTLAVLGTSVLLSEMDNALRAILPPPRVFSEVMGQVAGGRESLLAPFLALVIVAPVTEEPLFRGLILRGFLGRYSATKAIVVSALLFGALHLNPWQFLPGFCLGLLFAWVMVQTRSLVPTLYGHALNNSVPLIVGLCGVQIPGFTIPVEADAMVSTQFQPLWLDAIGVACCLGGLVALAHLFRPGGPRPAAAKVASVESDESGSSSADDGEGGGGHDGTGGAGGT